MDNKRDLTSDMNNLKDFIGNKLSVYFNWEGCVVSVKEFSIDDLKELRYLASLALVEALCSEHKSIMTDIFKEN